MYIYICDTYINWHLSYERGRGDNKCLITVNPLSEGTNAEYNLAVAASCVYGFDSMSPGLNLPVSRWIIPKLTTLFAVINSESPLTPQGLVATIITCWGFFTETVRNYLEFCSQQMVVLLLVHPFTLRVSSFVPTWNPRWDYEEIHWYLSTVYGIARQQQQHKRP